MRAKRRLGTSDIEVSPIGLGCWQFSSGIGLIPAFWDPVDPGTVDAIVRASLDGGIDWFDTAEAYGGGRSERALSAALQHAGKRPGDVVIATKWWPLFRTARQLETSSDARLGCLAPFGIDLYQIHQPVALASVEAQMRALGGLVHDGRVRTAGVSNFSAGWMRRAHAELARQALPLVSNQVPYSLLDRRIERKGVLAAAKELGVTIIAYSPLAQGLLTGKFHDDPALAKTRTGPRKYRPAFRERGLAKSRGVIEEVRAIAKAHGAAPAEVALAWLLQYAGDTVVAIPGATKASHVEANVRAMDLVLTTREVARLDHVSYAFR